MVLRLIGILFIFHLGLAQAQSYQKSMYLKAAQKYFLKNDYNKSLETLSKYYKINEIQRLPESVLNLLGLIYLKQKKYFRSARVFHMAIRKSYKNVHEKAVRAYLNSSLDEVKLPERLLRIYYHMGQNYYYIYSQNQNPTYFKAAYTYFKICEEKEHLDNYSSSYLESLNAKKTYVEKQEFTSSWYSTFGYLLFQEPLTLVNDETDAETDLLSNSKGYCLGSGFRYANASRGFDIHGCYYVAKANVASESGSYSQNNISVNGLYLSSGYFFRPAGDGSSIGFSLPLFLRQGEFTEPDGYSIPGKGQLNAGFSVDAEWALPIMSLYMNIANLGATNLFLIQAKYDF